MQVWRFTGGSHFTALQSATGNETAQDARPHRQFDAFSDFFHTVPHLEGRR
jgi:hypothetical protein